MVGQQEGVKKYVCFYFNYHILLCHTYLSCSIKIKNKMFLFDYIIYLYNYMNINNINKYNFFFIFHKKKIVTVW